MLTPPVVVHQNPNVEVHELQSIETNNPKDFVTRGSEGPEFEIDRILQALSNDQKPNDVEGKYTQNLAYGMAIYIIFILFSALIYTIHLYYLQILQKFQRQRTIRKIVNRGSGPSHNVFH